MKFKTFAQYIAENQTDPDLVKKMEDYSNQKSEGCPRCGLMTPQCICAERDYGSTINLHRLGKGKVKKPINKFKTE